MSADDADVVVVGAGLAGLACARTLERAGLAVVVLESAPEVGGRVRTELVDGFRCDIGFQLVNPAYPAVRCLVDVDALRLRTFEPGVAVRRHDGPGALAVLADPRRAPRLLPRTVRSAWRAGYLDPVELFALARWAAPALGSPRSLLSRADTTLAASLDAAGARGALRREVLEPFLAGVLADDTGASSAAFVRLLVRCFLLGTPGVPAGGMGELPRQLAAGLHRPVRCGTAVEEVHAGSGGAGGPSVRTASGPLRSRAVVVATDGPDAGALLGSRLLDRRAETMNGLRTWWFAASRAPRPERMLVVDARRGPVVNTAVLSAVAPAYAPPGRSLVQATTLLPTEADERVVRRELDRLWGTSTSDWELVVRHDVARSLPRQLPPLQPRRPVALGDGLFVAGDHRDTASQQGALVSGRRAARAVLLELAGRRA
ncbi:Flavin containing amine oxidoreductase [Pedococcus cremeus]|uniref:Flavin containing amine oxidoreductase n=1 Tax=Pedococcus cremeus TaxID=587636 RepID=A0A1H9QX98_9MICO|nr:NAD(P)/FAD-dependent oxidoreductase [Pedococcus cremeus]SER64845.1 Flavin containing amine oxidoreductase [Pedococcus cremeus]